MNTPSSSASEGTVLDAWLDHWEDLKAEGQTLSADDFLARYHPDAPHELVREFKEVAEELELAEPLLRRMRQDAAPEGRNDHGKQPAKMACLEPGMQVDEYRLVQPISHGGFGQVWRAEGRGGFPVAVKLVPQGQLGSIEMAALERIKGLGHAHVLPSSAAWQWQGWFVIVCELARRTLADCLQECFGQGLEGIPAPELLRYLQDAAEGLDFLGESNIQHRDVKPANLLLVGGAVKVGDLGLVRHLQSTSSCHLNWMTVPYAAPEMFDGQVSRHTDQYSLAVTYCELRGGRLPFEGDEQELRRGHTQGEPDLSMVPEIERPVLTRALNKDPEGRWPSCTAFARALADIHARQRERREQLEKWVRHSSGGITTILHEAWPDLVHRMDKALELTSLVMLAIDPSRDLWRHAWMPAVVGWLRDRVRPPMSNLADDLRRYVDWEARDQEGHAEGAGRGQWSYKVLDASQLLCILDEVAAQNGSLLASVKAITHSVIYPTLAISSSSTTAGMLLSLLAGYRILRQQGQLRKRFQEEILPGVKEAVLGSGVEHGGKKVPSLKDQLCGWVERAAQEACKHMEGN